MCTYVLCSLLCLALSDPVLCSAVPSCALSALLVMFFLEYYDMLSGGALGALTVGLVTCYTWEHGKPAKLSQGPSQNFSTAVERVMAVVST